MDSLLPPLPPLPPPPPSHPPPPASLPGPPLKQQHHLQPPPPPPTANLNLEQHLPQVTHDQIPLAYLIDRVVAQAYADLANLQETLPSQPDQLRKRSIVDYVLHTRRQLIKLLVLTRWSTEADRVGKAMNIIGFLSSQNHLLTSTVDALTETHAMLAGARVRNYDLTTALSVLTTGRYDALPSVVRESFAGEEKMKDEEVIGTMREVDEVLRWRLVMGLERLPRGLRLAPYRIADGRVTFTSPGLWKASFTYGGDNKGETEETGVSAAGAEWYLLGIKFLFKVKDARGSWSDTPTGPLKEHLLSLVNAALIRRPYLLPPPEPQQSPPPPPPEPSVAPSAAGADASAAPEDPSKPGEGRGFEPPLETDEDRLAAWKTDRAVVIEKRKRDRPLSRAYTFLQRLALGYQLEGVYEQGVRLGATSWAGSGGAMAGGGGGAGGTGTGKAGGLRVEMRRQGAVRAVEEGGGEGRERWEGDEVRVGYWSASPPSTTSSTSSKPPPPPPSPFATDRPPGPGGVLVFSLQPPSPSPPSSSATASATSASRTRSSARERALQAALGRASHSTALPPPAPPAATPAPPAVANGFPTASATPAPSTSASAPAATDDAELAAPPPPPGGEPDESDPTLPLSLSITWLLPSSYAHLSAAPPPSLLPSSSSGTEGNAPDLDRILREVTERHAGETVRFLAEEVKERGGWEGARVVYPLKPGSSGKGKEREEVREEDEADEGEQGLPYLHFPLHGSHALGAHILPLTGRFELRPAASSLSPSFPSSSLLAAEEAAGEASGGEGTAARDQRLRVATERIDRERFVAPLPVALAAKEDTGGKGKGRGGAMGEKEKEREREKESERTERMEKERARGWMRGVGEVVARIRATTILDDLETLLLLLSLPTPTRRLPIPPREFPKFGPAFSTSSSSSSSSASGRSSFLFAPLSHPAAQSGLEGFYLALVLVDEEGVRPALVSTREAGDGTTTWLEVVEVGWIALPAAEGGGGGGGGGETRTLGFAPGAETLRRVWRYAARRAALFRVEQELARRRVPFRVVQGSVGTGGGDAEPYLVVTSRALVRSQGGVATDRKGKEVGGEEGEGGVAWRNAAVMCTVNEDGGVRTTLHARFRFPSPGSASISSDPTAPPRPQDGRPALSALSALPPNVLYNPKQDVVVFAVDGDLETAVERLLRAYAAVAQSVLTAQQAAPPSSSTAVLSTPAPPPPSAPTKSSAASVNGSGGDKASTARIVNGAVRPFG